MPSVPRCRLTSSQTCSARGADPMRCICGALIARLVPGGVELKCRRCKRTVVVALAADDGE